MSQQKQNEPSRAAMELTKQLNRAGNLYWFRILFDCETNEVEARFAAAIDAAMKPERESAEKMAAIVEHVATDGAEITPQLVAAASKALAAYEAKGK